MEVIFYVFIGNWVTDGIGVGLVFDAEFLIKGIGVVFVRIVIFFFIVYFRILFFGSELDYFSVRVLF